MAADFNVSLMGDGRIEVRANLHSLRDADALIKALSNVRFALPDTGADEFAIFKSFLHGGQKVEAIKLVRQCASLGLKEAKDYVEDLGSGRTPMPADASEWHAQMAVG